LHVIAQKPRRVALVVHLMSYTDERSLEVAELLIDVASEIEPADDSEDEGRRLGDRKQIACLVERVTRLHDDRAGYAVLAKQRLEVVRPVPPAQCVGHPG